MSFDINKYTVKCFGKIICEHKIMACKLSIISQEREQGISVFCSLKLFYHKLNKGNKVMI